MLHFGHVTSPNQSNINPSLLDYLSDSNETSRIPGKGAYQIFEAHLRGSVLTDGDATVRPDDVKVGLRDDPHAEVVEGTGEEASEGRDEGHAAVATTNTDTNLKGNITDI